MKYLYQYTTIEALECILKNRTIRLRPLSSMDDMEEALSKDCKAIGDLIFVSCWSEEPEEMIPMWYMYSDQCKGVRIGLPENPFEHYVYSEEEQIQYGLSGVTGIITTGIPIEDILNKDYTVSPFHSEHFLKKIKYTDEEELLKPSLWKHQTDSIQFLYGQMGRYKNEYWSFQKEYRYTLYILPMNLSRMGGLVQLGLSDIVIREMKNMSDGNAKLPIDYYDLHIAQNMLERMEIVLGPLMDENDEKRVRTLVGGISDRIIVKRSELAGKIRSK